MSNYVTAVRSFSGRFIVSFHNSPFNSQITDRSNGQNAQCDRAKQQPTVNSTRVSHSTIKLSLNCVTLHVSYTTQFLDLSCDP
jgi:hypothetical protein